ncbi:MAG TPA: hypothetical protein VGQ83_21535 [Polyangia bacterium]
MGVLIAAVLVAAEARSAPPPEAVKLFSQCVADFEAGRHPAARECFVKVYVIYKSPVVLFNLGRTEEALGNIVEAYEAYQGCAADTTGTLSAEERADVQQRMEALVQRLALVKVPPLPAGAVVRIDGKPRSTAAAGGIPVLPGEHEVVVAAPGMQPFSEKLTLAGGGTHELAVRLQPPAPKPVVAPPPPPPPPPPYTPPPPPSGGGARTAGWVIGGLGVASLVTGTVFGVMARGKHNDALTHCSRDNASLCDPTGVSLTNDAFNLALISTVTFIVGGTALATGIILYLVGGPERAPSASRVRLMPVVGPTTAGLTLQGGF